MILIILTGVTTKCFSQENTYGSVSVKNNISIFLSTEDKQLNYVKDNPIENENRKRLKNGEDFSARTNQINILFKDKNPLKYDVEILENKVPDPNAIAVDKFIGDIAGLLKTINFPSSDGQPFDFEKATKDLAAIKPKLEKLAKSKDSLAVLGKTNSANLETLISQKETEIDKLEKEKQNIMSKAFKSINSIELIHMLLHVSDSKCFEKRDVELLNFISTLNIIDNSLYNWNTSFKNNFTTLVNIENFDEFKKILPKMKDSIVVLTQRNKNNETLFQEFKEKFDTEYFPSDIENCFYLRLYTNSVLDFVEKKAKEIIEKRIKLMKSFENLNNELSKKYDNASSTNNSYVVKEVEMENGFLKELTIKINIRNFSIKDNELQIESTEILSQKITIRKYSLFAFDYAPGVIYANQLKFPIYSTITDNNNNTYVADGGSDKPIILPANFLNVILRNPTLYAYPMVQFGIAIAQTTPAICFGGGFKFYKHLSISGGWLGSFYKGLDKLSIGDKINSNAELEKDLKVKSTKLSPYFGIQYSF